MDPIMVLVLILLAGAVAFVIGKSLWGVKNAMPTAVIAAILVLAGLWYGGYVEFETIEDETAAITTIPVTFNVDTYVNGTANDIDNSSIDASGFIFTTPFVSNTTGHVMRDTAASAYAHGSAFVDPIYNFSVRPIAAAGVTADDLVTLKFSARDPGECITSSGTDYRLIAQDDDSDPYLYFKVVKASDGTVLQDWTSTSGTVSFLYTESVYVWLNVVYYDAGCSRMTDFTTKSTTVTLSNLDGSWSQTYTIQVMPIGSRA